jgi:hypothetical protein
MAVKVKVKLSGKHAADYLGQLPAPGMGSPSPKIEIKQKGKRKPLPSRKGLG